MTRDEILAWLLEEDEERLADLWYAADRVRRETVGDAVHLRGLVEFGNRCERCCLYCGLRAPNRALARYRMTAAEILDAAREAVRRGCGTVVLQAGEELAMPAAWLGDVVARIKAETPLAVTLGVGERPPEDYRLWREQGADRYLLRFETSDAELLRRLHPPRAPDLPSRLELLAVLRDLGYETGGGVMVGLPGQTYASLARDLELFRELDLDMIGIGCYVPHPGTPLAAENVLLGAAAPTGAASPEADGQAPATPETTLKVVALARIVRPDANIPATTALATVAADGHAAGLRRGANVVMPDLTPLRYRRLYDIYPTPLRHEDGDPADDILRTILECGRTAGTGPGGRARRGGGGGDAARPAQGRPL